MGFSPMTDLPSLLLLCYDKKEVFAMQSIFAKLLYETEKQHDTVLVTIVRESGSTPRGIGAQMLVSRSGAQVGTIGGGNVEHLAIRHAQELIGQQRSDVHEYKLHKNDAEDIGMVCGGDVTVLFSFISAADSRWTDTASLVLERIARREEGILVLPLDGSAAYISDTQPDGEVFSLPLSIGERAILFGAGHCSLALAPILQSVGFRVTVFDNRSDLVTKARFPGADALICGDFEKIGDYLTVGADDYVVVMTSGHSFDFQVQEQVLRHPFAYVGVIGSRHKTASVNARLREAGVDEAAISAIHTPVGMAIKAVTPEEIAVSIAGEMIYERALRRENAGIHLRGCPMH